MQNWTGYLWLLFLGAYVVACTSGRGTLTTKTPPQADFVFEGHQVTVQAPEHPAPGMPWAWYAEFMGVAPRIDQMLLGRGYHVVHLATPDMFGSPAAMAIWSRFYETMTAKGFSPRPVLIAASRGGLYVYNWASRNPGRVSAIVALSPVCDFKSWPRQIPSEWAKLKAQYHFTSDAEAMAFNGNPVDSLAPLAAAKVPLFHAYGTLDDVVPWEANTGLTASRYRALGGEITVVPMSGLGHDIYAMVDPSMVQAFLEGR